MTHFRPTPSRSAAAHHPGTSLLAPLRRRWWVILLSVGAVAGLATQIADRVPAEYFAESVLIVPAGGPLEPPPGDADGAQRLARTYASVIPTDPAILAAAAQVAGTPQEVLEAGLDVVYENGTALFRISYTGTDPVQTLSAVRAMTTVVGSSTPPRTIAPGSIQVVRVPSNATKLPSTSDQALPIGLVVGLGLGLLLAFVLERSQDHLDTPALLARWARGPATPLADLTPGGAQALLSRWQELAGREDVVVALVPTVQKQSVLTEAAALRIAHLAAMRGLRVNVVDTRPGAVGSEPVPLPAGTTLGDGWSGASITLTPAGAPGGPDSGELAAKSADFCVLVVKAGTPARRVLGALDSLRQFGVEPSWSLLAPATRRWVRGTRGESVPEAAAGASSRPEADSTARPRHESQVDSQAATAPSMAGSAPRGTGSAPRGTGSAPRGTGRRTASGRRTLSSE